MLFTLPYNNTDPEKFILKFEPYREYIHSFYFGLPGVFSAHNPDRTSGENLINELHCTYHFLNMVKGRFDTVLCINTLLYPENIEEFRFRVIKELVPLVEHLDLKAVNLASPSAAAVIHEMLPQLDIQTSCNTYGFVNNLHRLWNKQFGTTIFNLPREAMRTPGLLKAFRETGYQSKCIVNEACIYGCPGNVEHACSFILNKKTFNVFCDQKSYRLSDLLRSNFIAPHFLKDFEPFVDIFKIAGRGYNTEHIFEIFRAYLTGDAEADVSHLLHARNTKLLRENGIVFRAKQWPKKTLTCECKECDTCNICEKAMEHAVKRQGLDPSTLTRPI